MSDQQFFAFTIGFVTNPAPTVSASPPSADVDYGNTAILTLSLATSVRGAVFADPPVVWDGAAPSGVTVVRESATEATITEKDGDPVTTDYSFRAVVAYSGQSYQSEDPIIINKGSQ